MPSHLLIISDIHIGEYAKELDRIHYLKGATRRDEDLCRFLEYHQTRRIDGHPWRLVINGDFIDFIAVTFQPGDDGGVFSNGISDDEEKWGLDSSADRAVWKLNRIVDRHSVLFTYLADFVGHGHTIEILYGNHDVEFWWPDVHDTFRQHLKRIYFGGEAIAGHNPQEYVDRIKFHPWFLYEKDKFYIEHGNQYDDFSSFDLRMNPLAPDDHSQLAMPVSHMAIRYFVNQYRGFRSHDKDSWTIIDYVRWLYSQGMDRATEVFRLYLHLAVSILSFGYRYWSADRTDLRADHDERLQMLAAAHGMSPQQIEDLDAVRNSPITQSMGRMVQAVGLDRQLAVLGFVAVLYGLWVIPFDWLTTLILMSGATLAFVAIYKMWGQVRDRYFGGNVTTRVAPKVDAAAAEIAHILPVRYVIFGHTHIPRKDRVAQSPARWYLNSGSWLAPRKRERHTRKGGKDTCPSRLTFIVFRDGGTPDARLFRWCARDGKPVPFDPSTRSETLESEEIAHTNNDGLQSPKLRRKWARASLKRGQRPSRSRRLRK